MGGEIGRCRAGTEETSSTLEWQVVTTEQYCESTSDLRRHSDVRSSGTEGRAHEASEHSDTRTVTSLDLGGRC